MNWTINLIVCSVLFAIAIIISVFSYYNVEIDNDEITFISKHKSLKYKIDSIKRLHIKVSTTSTFEVDIGVKTFVMVALTKKNFAVLNELITRCNYSRTSIEDLDVQVIRSFSGLSD